MTVPDAIAQRFDTELNRRVDILAKALHRLDRERMADQAEAMIAALDRDLIDPADFDS